MSGIDWGKMSSSDDGPRQRRRYTGARRDPHIPETQLPSVIRDALVDPKRPRLTDRHDLSSWDASTGRPRPEGSLASQYAEAIMGLWRASLPDEAAMEACDVPAHALEASDARTRQHVRWATAQLLSLPWKPAPTYGEVWVNGYDFEWWCYCHAVLFEVERILKFEAEHDGMDFDAWYAANPPSEEDVTTAAIDALPADGTGMGYDAFMDATGLSKKDAIKVLGEGIEGGTVRGGTEAPPPGRGGRPRKVFWRVVSEGSEDAEEGVEE
jgi:hypothetical protein